ncbi:hypothetical protein CONLIGDRAFT_476272 [Coniochaeta ligniaria NRRL 30616]|uniref:Uncharacterized protein n=1 Tax=Coniochaeta ligniaria NRRL 30616 TaxID=1408157 RepID=A0A1J7IZM9_9PEZI|nr:hypothetical protein CONLIGDRAFT_476272 [Coniochaeta ligniaria NRRL 30616]
MSKSASGGETDSLSSRSGTLSAKKVQDQNGARLVLEYAADQKKRIFEPMSLFDDRGAMTFYPPCTHIPAHCALVRRVTVTPTRIYFHTPSISSAKPETRPTLETTNRVLRHYSQLQDNFLRVSVINELADHFFELRPEFRSRAGAFWTKFTRLSGESGCEVYARASGFGRDGHYSGFEDGLQGI